MIHKFKKPVYLEADKIYAISSDGELIREIDGYDEIDNPILGKVIYDENLSKR